MARKKDEDPKQLLFDFAKEPEKKVDYSSWSQFYYPVYANTTSTAYNYNATYTTYTVVYTGT